VPGQRADLNASLVVRAFVDGADARLLVRVVEVDPSWNDRLVGVTVSTAAASRMVAQWLNSLTNVPARPDPARVEVDQPEG
jgi:hypothetical protein